MTNVYSSRPRTRLVAAIGVLTIGGLMALAATAFASGSSDQPAEGEQIGKLQVSTEAQTAIDRGVTLADWDAAYAAMSLCLSPATRSAMSAAETDLSGMRRLYSMTGATEGELTLFTEDHDRCYQANLMALDIEFQLSTEADVNRFYESLSACAAKSAGLRELRLDGPVTKSMLGDVDARRLDDCVRTSKG